MQLRRKVQRIRYYRLLATLDPMEANAAEKAELSVLAYQFRVEVKQMPQDRAAVVDVRQNLETAGEL